MLKKLLRIRFMTLGAMGTPTAAPGIPTDRAVTLRSSDGQLFIADLFVLADKSGVFEAMGDTAKPGLTPIDIDAPSSVLSAFIDMAHSRPIPVTQVIPLETLDALLHLGEMYDAPCIALGIVPELEKHLRGIKWSEPWAVFKFAANLRQPDLARKGLEHMYMQRGQRLRSMRNKRMTEGVVKDIPLDYAVALIRALDTVPDDRTDPHDKGRARWLKVSQAFKVKA